jgi:hypothetical protein
MTDPVGIPARRSLSQLRRFFGAALLVLACGCGSVGWGPYLGDDCIGVDGGPCELTRPDGGDATVSDSTVEAAQDG